MQSHRQQPRRPNRDEVSDLVRYWADEYKLTEKEARTVIEDAYSAVFDHYTTGAPGYGGKLMLSVWDGDPSFYDCFVWREGNITKVER